MVNVKHKRCAYPGYTKVPSFGQADANKAECCQSRRGRDGGRPQKEEEDLMLDLAEHSLCFQTKRRRAVSPAPP